MCKLCPPKGKTLTDAETRSLLVKLASKDLSDPHIVKLMDRLLGTDSQNLDSEFGRAWEDNYRSN